MRIELSKLLGIWSGTFFTKVGCVFPMVIWSEFRMVQYRDGDHREDAFHLIIGRGQSVRPKPRIAIRLIQSRIGSIWKDRGVFQPTRRSRTVIIQSDVKFRTSKIGNRASYHSPFVADITATP